MRAVRTHARPPGSSLANILANKANNVASLPIDAAISGSLKNTSCTRRAPDGLIFSPRKLVAPTHSPEQPPALRVRRLLLRRGLGVFAPTVAHEACAAPTHKPDIHGDGAVVRAGSVDAPTSACVSPRTRSVCFASTVKSTVWGGKCLTSRLTRSAALRPNPRPPRQPPYMGLAAK